MKTITFSKFDKQFDQYFEQVADMNEQLNISLDDGRKVVLVSKKDWDEAQDKIYSKTETAKSGI